MLLGAFVPALPAAELPPSVRDLISNRCADCHDAETKKGNLDLTAHGADFSNAESFARWVKVYERVETGEMPNGAIITAHEFENGFHLLPQTRVGASRSCARRFLVLLDSSHRRFCSSTRESKHMDKKVPLWDL